MYNSFLGVGFVFYSDVDLIWHLLIQYLTDFYRQYLNYSCPRIIFTPPPILYIFMGIIWYGTFLKPCLLYNVPIFTRTSMRPPVKVVLSCETSLNIKVGIIPLENLFLLYKTESCNKFHHYPMVQYILFYFVSISHICLCLLNLLFDNTGNKISMGWYNLKKVSNTII